MSAPVIQKDLASLDYPNRLAALRERGIGLWDVVSAARREGSGDSAIRDARHNDLGGLRSAYPKLRAIAFNGGLAAKEGSRLLEGKIPGLELISLPSSSAANARMSFEEKAAIWRRLRDFVAP